MNKQSNELLEKIMVNLNNSLPTVFSRKSIPKYFGETISVGTIANLTCLGFGPPFICNGRNAIYEKHSFLEWFRKYLEGGIKAVKDKPNI